MRGVLVAGMFALEAGLRVSKRGRPSMLVNQDAFIVTGKQVRRVRRLLRKQRAYSMWLAWIAEEQRIEKRFRALESPPSGRGET